MPRRNLGFAGQFELAHASALAPFPQIKPYRPDRVCHAATLLPVPIDSMTPEVRHAPKVERRAPRTPRRDRSIDLRAYLPEIAQRSRASKTWRVVQRSLDMTRVVGANERGVSRPRSGRCWLAAENVVPRKPANIAWTECATPRGRNCPGPRGPETPSRARSTSSDSWLQPIAASH